jgi:hypothetical protein
MCVIVDANLASRIFAQPAEEDFAPVIDWLMSGEGGLVVGGKLASELGRLGNPRRLVLELLRSGRARQIPAPVVRAEEERVAKTGLCRSNDQHVVALARVSGARTLCTLDRDLQGDFRNPQLVAKPRGSIYQRREHVRLLRHTSSCGRASRRRR